jgi:hypothetical protein
MSYPSSENLLEKKIKRQSESIGRRFPIKVSLSLKHVSFARKQAIHGR